MDQKTWPWRKRSSEKTIIANGKADFDVKGKEQVQILPNEKEVALEESVKILNEQLALLTSECNAKEELLQNHAKMAHEAMAGQEKAEAEMMHLKKELNEALQQKLAANDRLGKLNVALKDCMQLLNSVREEQDQRVNDAIMRTSEDFEKAHKRLEEKLSETSKKLASLTVENSHLRKAIQVKESLIEDLRNSRSQVEAEFAILMARLDSVEKENAFLRYEFRVLEKDLDIRNEEIEYTRRSADTSQKHYLESMNKVKKLETECQRLRVLVRKRLPAPALLANMKAEVESQGRCQIETRRRKSYPVITGGLVVRESTRENLDISSKRISFLVDRLQNVEQENKILRDILAKKDDALSHSVTACTQIVPISTQGEAQLREPHKAEQSLELVVPNTMSSEISSVSDINLHEEHETNSSRSWASALISELENFKDGDLNNMPEHKMLGMSDMSLMDDFVEMEKLAVVAVNVQQESCHASTNMHHVLADSLKSSICQNQMDSTCMELVPVGQELSESHQQPERSDSSSTKPGDWLQAVVKVIFEQLHVSGRSIDELLEDIKFAVHSETYDILSPTHYRPSELLPISGYITWKSPTTSPVLGSAKDVPGICSLEEGNHEVVQSVSITIGKIIELVSRLGSGDSSDFIEPDNWLETDLGNSPSNQLIKAECFAIHVFGWKTCELDAVLKQFVGTCKYLVDGKVSFQKFTAELSSALEWIMKNCITNQAITGSRYELKDHFAHNSMGTATELGSVQNLLLEMEKIHSILQVENKGLKTELNLLKSLQKDLELNLQSARDKSEALSSDLEQSQRSINSLQSELETLNKSKRAIEDLFENQKMTNEELDTQLTVAKARLNDVSQKLSSLEVELEDKNHCCEELEGTCLELQLQLESFSSKENLKDDINREEQLLQTGWEIKAASMKLAQCEASILNLGNQLKALNSPKEPSYVNKKLKLNRRLSLLDRMMSEDSTKMEDLKPSQTKELTSIAEKERQSPSQTNSGRAFYASSGQLAASEADLGLKYAASKNSQAGALVVVPSKKRGKGIGFVRKLLLWKKRGSTKKTPFSFTA